MPFKPLLDSRLCSGALLVSASLLSSCAQGAPATANAQSNPMTPTISTSPGQGNAAVNFRASTFPLEEVRLTSGPFKAAQETDRKYLLTLEPDRMLSNLLKVAKLTPKAPPYGGWDANGAGSLGHYLSACAQMAQATGDPELHRRVDYIVSEMARCQQTYGDGGLYAFGFDRDQWFPQLKKDHVIPVGVTAWYITHKLMAGLRDAWFLCGNQQAKDVLIKMSDWAVDVTANLSPENWQQMLSMGLSEHGSPHEILADVYAATGDKKYLATAEKFRQNNIFDALAKGDSRPINTVHANAAIVKFIGYERIYELTGDKAWHDAALNFFNDVVGNRSWSNGGNSQWEHFFSATDSENKVDEICGPETCNTYNMLKLSLQLYALDPQARTMDFVERALYNHILPSEAPGEGGFVYYTSQRPGHYRVFSRPFDAFWCCVGTGMENHARYNEFIYAKGKGATGNNRLYVNLFVPSELNWKETSIALKQDTDFPSSNKSILTLTLPKAQTFTLSIRQPGWIAKGAMKVSINGKNQPVISAPGSYVDIPRTWKSGDKIEVELPMQLRAEMLRDSTDYASFLYGPVLLAGKLGDAGLTHSDFFGGGPNSDIGTSAQLAKKELPITDFPVLIKTGPQTPTPAQLTAQLQPVQGQPLNFRLNNTSTGGKDTILAPFYDVSFERYSLYWPIMNTGDFERKKVQETADFAWEAQQAAEEKRADLNQITLDRVIIGDDASEGAHGMASDGSSNGGEGDNRWRDAKGFFSYKMKVSATESSALRVRYYGGDAGREFDVLVDGQVIGTQKLTARRPTGPLFAIYAIPANLTQGKTEVTVRFQPKVGSVAGGVFDVRTVVLKDDVKPLV